MRNRFIIGAAVLAVLAVGGAAWAAIPDSGTGLIHGCYSTTTGALRVIDPSKGQACASGEAALNWNDQGIRWRGTWKSTSAYALNDAVTLNGSSYIAKAANTNSMPPSTNWSVLASKAQTYANVFSQSNETSGSFPVLFGSNLTTIATTQGLPAGSYEINAQADVFMDNDAQDVQCVLEDSHGNFANGEAETTGPPDGSAPGTSQTLSLVDAFGQEPTGTKILLKCATANGADPAASEVVSASLAATQVGRLSLNGTSFSG